MVAVTPRPPPRGRSFEARSSTHASAAHPFDLHPNAPRPRVARRALAPMLALLATTLATTLLFALSGVAVAASSASPEDIVLVEGATYRARLKLSFLQCLASRDRIGKKFGRSGFTSVRVFMSARELPLDWPTPFRSKAGSCERYAEGRWSRPSIPRKRPSSIESWWVARPAVLAR
jgi:hypothetical protein